MSDRWVTGDQSGLSFPADPATFRDAGVPFLTNAFRTPVSEITRCEDVTGGSTGRKMLLDVEYPDPQCGLHRELFVKFSRDFDDPVRDRGKVQMESEVKFASLSLAPGFPIVVPRTLFADYHRATGTGILISERIPFGTNGIEPQYHKCLDYEMPRPADHYRALLTAIARLAGAHRSGRLPAHLTDEFPVDLRAAAVGEPPPLTPDRLHRRVTRLAEFADAYPGLLPDNVRSPGFLDRLAIEAPQVLQNEAAIWHRLAEATDYIALSHWNANVDNAWFWTGADGVLCCGLMDWGCVSQLNVAMAIWGAMSAAEIDMWDDHFDEFLELFCNEVVVVGRAETGYRRTQAAGDALRVADGRHMADGCARFDPAEWRPNATRRTDPAIKGDEACARRCRC